jgi:NTE family protein
VIAVDVAGPPADDCTAMPDSFECYLAAVLVMAQTIIDEKIKHGAPDIVLRPNVGIFRALDFLRASAILRAAEPVKAELREKLGKLLA